MSSFYAAATAIVENPNGEILMVQEGKDHIHGKWDFPGGGWEDRESITECVKREVLEETGYLTEPEYLIGIWKGESFRDGNEVIVFVFKSEIVDENVDAKEKDGEIIGHDFFSPEEIRELELRREDKLKILEKYEKGEKHSLDILFNNLDLLTSE